MMTRNISLAKMRPWLLLLLFTQILAGRVFSQQVKPTDTVDLPNGTDGLTFNPRKADSTFLKVRSDLPWNEFTGIYATFKIGAGYIGDYATYIQDDVFKTQMDSLGLDVKPNFKTRDFRILGSGRLLKTKRHIGYKFAYMYDGDKKIWMIRETGLTIAAPELKGTFFIGRTKEGFSMIKVMNGHSGLTNERQMTLDPIPILADGIKYFGYFPKSRIFMNLGAYNDIISKGQSFSTFRWQYVARAGWVPVNNPEKETVLHIAGNFQYGKTTNGKFTVKSRPESNPTPQLINTGEFTADHSNSVGAEMYYSNKRFMIGSEVIQHHFYADNAANHKFQGGNVILSFFLTQTHRPYNTQSGNIFGFAPVKKSVFKGGLGAIELVLHASTFELNDGTIKGGKFTRFTPMINWYLMRTMRLEFIYGYGILERLNMKGKVQFFETRIQFSFL
jgi:phosphate-selective porin OprO/OprP